MSAKVKFTKVLIIKFIATLLLVFQTGITDVMPVSNF